REGNPEDATAHGGLRHRPVRPGARRHARRTGDLRPLTVTRPALVGSRAVRARWPAMPYRAVLFDIGGVVVGSPLEAIARYEAAQGIAAGSINRIVIASGATGAWSRLERGELRLEEFYPAFDADCAAAGCRISARAL